MKKIQCDICGKQETADIHGDPSGYFVPRSRPTGWLHLSVSHPDPKRANVCLDLCSSRCLVESMPTIQGELEKAPARRHMPPGLGPVTGEVFEDDPYGGGQH